VSRRTQAVDSGHRFLSRPPPPTNGKIGLGSGMAHEPAANPHAPGRRQGFFQMELPLRDDGLGGSLGSRRTRSDEAERTHFSVPFSVPPYINSRLELDRKRPIRSDFLSARWRFWQNGMMAQD